MTVTGTLWSLQLNLLSVAVFAAPDAHSDDERRILALVEEMGTITVRNVVETIGLDKRTAGRRLDDLTPSHLLLLPGHPRRWKRNGS